MSLGLLCLHAAGQARPTASAPGFALPELGGTMQYSLSTSESLTHGLYSTRTLGESTNISGNVALLTDSRTHPFNLVYSGGYLFSNSGQPSSLFQNMFLSQVLTIKRWDLIVSDGVSYLPETPTTGLSGIPGVGDLNVTPAPADGTGLGILTDYAPRLGNAASIRATRMVTGSLSVQGGGSYTILRFLGDPGTSSAVNGIDSNSYSGSGNASYRLDARNNVGASFTYTRSSFSGAQFSFTTQGVTGSYNRLWTRRLVMSLSGGPLRVSSSSLQTAPALALSADASVRYTGKDLESSLVYTRGTGNGSGVIPGSISDAVQYGFGRAYGRAWGLSGTVGYARTKSLPNLTTTPFSSKGLTASGQVSRALSRHASAFASYTVQNQSLDSSAASLNAFSGLYQIASFGLTYSPTPIHLGSH